MGDGDSSVFRFTFNGSLRAVPRGSDLSSDAGALFLREVDARLHLTEDLAAGLQDPRNPDLITHPLTELVRARIFAMALGYTDQDDLDVLRDDPVLRLVVSERRGLSPLDEPEDAQTPNGLASQPTQSRLVRALSSTNNLDAMNDFLFTQAEREFDALGLSGPVVLDIDSFPIQVYGTQPGSGYSGHYHTRCFHPLITMLSGTSAVLRADLRPGNVYTSVGAVEHLEQVVDRAASCLGGVKAVRGDAGFPCDEFFSLLEARNIRYALRLATNERLEALAAPYLRRPPGRPPKEPRIWFHELAYQADPWSRPRRIVLVVLERKGELFLHHFFLVTNFSWMQKPGPELLEFYRARGSMERHIGEIKSVLDPTLSSSPRRKSHYRNEEPANRTPPVDAEKANAATFLLFVLGYNLMNLVRNLLASSQEEYEPVPSLARVRERVLKVATRLIRSARYAFFLVNAACREVWEILAERITRIEWTTQLE